MKIFIPEGFIYFYVYNGGVDNILNMIYGSVNATFFPSYLYSINVYDVLGFYDHKIP